MTATKASRIGKRLGSVLSSSTSIATGYVWAKHGLVYGFAVWAGVLVICLALYGAITFNSGGSAASKP